MSEGIEDREAALHGIDAGQAWIANADTKIGLATAALALLTSAFIGRVGAVIEVAAASPAVATALLLGAGVVVFLLGRSGWHLVCGLLPETTAERANCFAWPSIAKLTDDEVAKPCAPDELRVQAWEQARCLAGIAQRKYTRFATGAKGLVVAFVALAIWMLAGMAATATLPAGGTPSSAPAASSDIP